MKANEAPKRRFVYPDKLYARCKNNITLDGETISVKFSLQYSAFIEGAQWQKENLLKDSVERVVKVDAGGYPYIDSTELYDYSEGKPLAKAGDKVKVVIIKED